MFDSIKMKYFDMFFKNGHVAKNWAKVAQMENQSTNLVTLQLSPLYLKSIIRNF